MHTLTSSMFLPAFMAVLEPPARRAVLKTYTAALFAMSIARGKPNIDVSYLMQAPLFPVGPGTTPKPGASRDCLSDPSDEATRGAWPSIVESALYATGECVTTSGFPIMSDHKSTTLTWQTHTFQSRYEPWRTMLPHSRPHLWVIFMEQR